MHHEKITTLSLTREDFLHSLANNAVQAAMQMDGRTLMTAADAQRARAIFNLLHLNSQDNEIGEPGQVEAQTQPAAHPALAGIEDRLAQLVA